MGIRTQIAINFNDQILVKLKPAGLEMLTKYYGGTVPNYIDTDDRGYTKFHMWNLMEIFGAKMYHGNPDLPFEMRAIIEKEG